MTDNQASINEHYARPGLSARILEAIKSAGIEESALTLEDLSKFDQLHFRGREATRTLAGLAELKPGMKVLDIGSGLGGPARTLAAEFGCTVLGVDITREYVRAAEMLTAMVGLDESVTFHEGSALDLEFDDSKFDAVWTQNAIMNIEDKERVFRETHRVLRPGGILALEALLAGPNDDIQYPIYWATTPAVNFMTQPGSLRSMLAGIGFEELVWDDITQEAIIGGRRLQPVPGQTPPPLGVHIIYSAVPAKARNTQQGLENGSFLDVYAVYRKAD